MADGMKVDALGNIFGAAPGGLYIIAPYGTLLLRFNLGVAIGNCTWGEDGSTLFIAVRYERHVTWQKRSLKLNRGRLKE